jgi:hypothetical protein
MITVSQQAEERIASQCSAFHDILSTFEALDPEITPHAELERCKKLAKRIKTALKALTPPEARQARSDRVEDVRATTKVVTERREAQEHMLEEEFELIPFPI